MNENENVNNEEIDNSSVSSENSQELFNLIQSIQSKMNNTNSDTNKNIEKNDNENCNNNINNNNLEELFENVVNNTKNIDNTFNKNSNSLDFSNIASLLQNIDLSSIASMFSNKTNNSNDNSKDFKNNDDSIFNGIDPSTILKFQRVFNSMNKSDPKKNLLLSLKPFLRKSRQDKLNEYITMLTIANAIGIFGSKGSDE